MSVSYKIEKGIPASEFPVNPRPINKLARKMQVDDSVLVLTAREAETLRRSLNDLGRVAMRRQLEDGTFRVWRVA